MKQIPHFPSLSLSLSLSPFVPFLTASLLLCRIYSSLTLSTFVAFLTASLLLSFSPLWIYLFFVLDFCLHRFITSTHFTVFCCLLSSSLGLFTDFLQSPPPLNPPPAPAPPSVSTRLQPSSRMESREGKLNSEFSEKIFSIFKDFMARVTEFEELVPVGSRFLTGFHQGLEFLRQDPIDKTSELVKNVINANKTKRLRSYLVAGCVKTLDSMQNISKLSTCHVGLHDYLTKGKSILSQLESLLEDVISTLRTFGENLPPVWDRCFADMTKDASTADDGEEVSLFGLEKHEDTDFALLMGVIYSMLKQDYEMQERIVLSLNPNSSSGDLESYRLMWSLRPFLNDDIMNQAWKLIS